MCVPVILRHVLVGLSKTAYVVRIFTTLRSAVQTILEDKGRGPGTGLVDRSPVRTMYHVGVHSCLATCPASLTDKSIHVSHGGRVARSASNAFRVSVLRAWDGVNIRVMARVCVQAVHGTGDAGNVGPVASFYTIALDALTPVDDIAVADAIAGAVHHLRGRVVVFYGHVIAILVQDKARVFPCFRN
jgi:hypothetical protein